MTQRNPNRGIIRRVRLGFEDQYTLLPNRWVRDTRLKYAALGVLVWLMSHAEGFEVSLDLIAQERDLGRDAVRTVVRNLEACGYLTREKRRGESGLFESTDWQLCDPWVAAAEQLTGLGAHETPPVDNLPLSRKNPRSHPATAQPTTVEPTTVEPTTVHPTTKEEPSKETTYSPNRSGESRANDRDSESDKTTDEYAAWSPGQKIHEARRRMVEATERERATAARQAHRVPPAPVIPRYVPDPEPELPRFTPEQAAAAEQARTLRCPARAAPGVHVVFDGHPTCLYCRRPLDQLTEENTP